MTLFFIIISVALVSGGQARILGLGDRRRGLYVALWLLASFVLASLYAQWAGVQNAPPHVRTDQRALSFLCAALVVAIMLWLGPKWARKRLAAADTWGRRFVALAVVQAPIVVTGAVLTFFADILRAFGSANF